MTGSGTSVGDILETVKGSLDEVLETACEWQFKNKEVGKDNVAWLEKTVMEIKLKLCELEKVNMNNEMGKIMEKLDTSTNSNGKEETRPKRHAAQRAQVIAILLV